MPDGPLAFLLPFVAVSAAALLLLWMLGVAYPKLRRLDARIVARNRRRSRASARPRRLRGPKRLALEGQPCPRCGEGVLLVEPYREGRRYRCSSGCGYVRGIGGRRPTQPRH